MVYSSFLLGYCLIPFCENFTLLETNMFIDLVFTYILVFNKVITIECLFENLVTENVKLTIYKLELIIQ